MYNYYGDNHFYYHNHQKRMEHISHLLIAFSIAKEEFFPR